MRLRRAAKWFWLGVAAAIIGYQLFIPPIVGLADNNDFLKITGRLHLSPADPTHDDRWVYLPRGWIVNPAFGWDSGLPSDELYLARAALMLSSLFPNRIFDIRWLGAVHAIVFLAAMAVVLFYDKFPLLPFVTVLIFTDVSYVAMFNSFYTDTASLLFFACSVACWLWAFKTRHAGWITAYVLCSLLLVGSKVQHSWLALLLCLQLFRLIGTRRKGIPLTVCVAALFATAVYMFVAPPADYRGQALWNSIFVKLLPASTNPDADMAELSIDPRFREFIGMDTYHFSTPDKQPPLRGELIRQTSFMRIAAYYAKRPRAGLRRFARCVWESTETRPSYLGNFERAEGFDRGQKSEAFGYWSSAKLWLEGGHPRLALAVLATTAVLVALAGSRFRWAWLLPAGVLGEMLISCFGDGLDWGRHQFLAQAMIDAWLCVAVCATTVLWQARNQRQRAVPARLGASERV
jgi:hypothetical protein